jgi:hypothetical protein
MARNIHHLPKPSGPFQVGKTSYVFTDVSWPNPFPAFSEPFRNVPIIIWYPSDVCSPCNLCPYISKQVRENLAQIYPKYRSETEVITNSILNAPISTKRTSFPTLLFNHGYSAHMEQNTIIMEHLASFGYIIVSVGHPHEGIMSYPDGTSSPMDEATFKQLLMDVNKCAKRWEEIENLLKSPDISFTTLKNLTKELHDLGGYRIQNMEIWVQDNIFIINQLEKLNLGSSHNMFANKLDFSNGIGIFGHSFGGNAAVITSVRDSRVICAINLDGTMYGGFSPKNTFEKPLMFIYNGMTWGIHKYYYLINQGSTFQMQIQGSKHADFMDNTLFRLSPEGFGKISGDVMMNILNKITYAFFQEYLCSKKTDWTIIAELPEVILERKN